MNDLTIICRDNQLYVDSREIAEATGVRHADLLRRIEKYESILLNAKLRSVEYFILSSYLDESGKENKCYLVTKKGCDMVANKMTGEKGILFTALYIEQFYKMEHQLKEYQSSHWQQTRLDSKSNRRMETDEINQFIQYAKEHGSRNAEKYYIALSKLADNAVGIQPHNRDAATASQLNNLILIEHIIGEVVKEGMQQGLYYKDIYKACKARIEQFREIVFFTQNKNALI